MNPIDDRLIDPRELRIGNILEYKGKFVHVTTLSLDVDDESQETIGFCELGKTSNEIADWNRALVKDLRRALITNGLLLRAGIVPELGMMATFRHYMNTAPGAPRGDLYKAGPVKLELVQERVFVWIHNFTVEISHFHQLQNLFYALTGEEIILA